MSKKCISCGAELENEAVFCDECGARQTVPQLSNGDQRYSAMNNSSSTTPQQEVKKKKNSGLGIASLIVGIISICTLGMFIIPEILGLIFGIIAMTDKDTKHQLALVGVITSGLAILMVIGLFIIGILA